MKRILQSAYLLIFFLAIVSCSEQEAPEPIVVEIATGDYERGPSGGRMLRDGEFAIELAIFETGVPPEFRAWPSMGDEPLPASAVDVEVILTRLGDEINRIQFNPAGDMLRGDMVVYEPHSFYVDVNANYRGQRYSWSYESLEGRTTITPDMAALFGIETEIAGQATIAETLNVIGSIKPNEEFSRAIIARYDGQIRSVNVSVGERVREGQPLVTLESNQSLQEYTINSPINGVVSNRGANPGEQSSGRILLEIMDTSRVWAELAVHPSDRSRVSVGQPVNVHSPLTGNQAVGEISSFKLMLDASQAAVARVPIDNSNGDFPPGTFIEAQVKLGEVEVPLGVRRVGLQPFRDFTVVYAKVGDTYEVRMLDLGRQDDTWVEVLGGLDTGTEYVTEGSYVLKADVEKSGASHDH